MAIIEYGKGYHFKVFFDNDVIPFSKLSGIESRLVETESIAEGGRNNTEYQVKKKKGKSQNTLSFERAVPVVQDQNTKITPGKTLNDGITVYLLTEDDDVYKTYIFLGCVVTKVSVDGLDAGQSNLVQQRIEVTYQSVEEDPDL